MNPSTLVGPTLQLLGSARLLHAARGTRDARAQLGISNVIVLAVLDDDFRITRPVELLTEEAGAPGFGLSSQRLVDILS